MWSILSVKLRRVFFMLKKISVITLSFLIILFFATSNAKPIFGAYTNSFEIYLFNPSSNAKILTVSKNEYPFIHNKVGESCKISGEFSLCEFLTDLSATIIFTEKLTRGLVITPFRKKCLIKGKFVDKLSICKFLLLKIALR